MQHWHEDMSFREQMEQIYTWFNEESQYPGFLKFYIYYLLEDGTHHNIIKLTEAEFVYFFTGIEGDYEYYNKLSIEGIIKDLYIKAKARGEVSLEVQDDQSAKIFLSFLVGPFITHGLLDTHIDSGELFKIILDRFLE